MQPFPQRRNAECQNSQQAEGSENADGQDLSAQYGAVELEQNNQTEADDADHAAVGNDLQAVEGDVGRNGKRAGLVGCSLLQV